MIARFEFVKPKGFSLQSLIIRLFTWSKFSHCRIRFLGDPSCVFETNPPKARYIRSDIHDVSYPSIIVGYLDIPISDTELVFSEQFITDNVGREYDWPSIYKIALMKILPFTKPWIFTKENNIQSFFCSELCLEYVECVKGVELAQYSESIDPQRLYTILKGSNLVIK